MKSLRQKSSSHGIILYDGICNLCNGFVRFVKRRDTRRNFHFAALQSDEGRELLKGIQPCDLDINTVFLVNSDRVYSESDAVLKILTDLGGIWSVFHLLVLVPKPIRDS